MTEPTEPKIAVDVRAVDTYLDVMGKVAVNKNIAMRLKQIACKLGCQCSTYAELRYGNFLCTSCRAKRDLLVLADEIGGGGGGGGEDLEV